VYVSCWFNVNSPKPIRKVVLLAEDCRVEVSDALGLLVLLENEKRNNDERDYGIGAQIIRALNVSKMKLISSSQIKRSALEGYGLEIAEYITL
jgi:GTP cyclohydrolase II